MVYLRYRRFLPPNHQFHKMMTKFDYTVETDGPPPNFTGEEIYAKVEHLKVVLGKGKFERTAPEQTKVKRKVKSKKKDSKKEKRKEVIAGDEAAEKKKKEKPIWKKRSIFWDLPYWKDLDV